MLVLSAVLAALLVPSAERAAGASVAGTITGAAAVNVRRGPGPDTAAITALHRGARVQVEERVGQWVVVVLESGERGYVNAAFVELAPGAALPAMAAVATAIDTPPAATPDPTATAVVAAAPAIDRELAALRERLASLEAAVEHSGSTSGSRPRAEEPAVAPPPVPTIVEPPAALDVGPSLALAGVGLIIGFLFGTLYGQRQERNRRSRVRF
ncbi:SH3 domain-containing protein [bacterium]|nr:SH3 domain-containing protein [bacterium]